MNEQLMTPAILPQKVEILKFFGVVLAFVNFISCIGFANNVGAFMLKYTVVQILSIFSYALSLALLETIFVSVLFMLLSIILPKGWLRGRFSAHSTLLYGLGMAFLYPWLGFTSGQGFNNLYIYFNTMPNKWFFGLLWGIIFATLCWLIARLFKNQTLYTKLDQIINRINILATLYLILDSIAVAVVLLRILL